MTLHFFAQVIFLAGACSDARSCFLLNMKKGRASLLAPTVNINTSAPMNGLLEYENIAILSFRIT